MVAVAALATPVAPDTKASTTVSIEPNKMYVDAKSLGGVSEATGTESSLTQKLENVRERAQKKTGVDTEEMAIDVDMEDTYDEEDEDVSNIKWNKVVEWGEIQCRPY